MGAVTRVRELLGIDAVEAVDGYRLSARGPRLPVCERCGALVDLDAQRAHTTWHAEAAGA